MVTLIANLTDEERRAPRTPRIRSRKCTRVFGLCIFEGSYSFDDRCRTCASMWHVYLLMAAKKNPWGNMKLERVMCIYIFFNFLTYYFMEKSRYLFFLCLITHHSHHLSSTKLHNISTFSPIIRYLITIIISQNSYICTYELDVIDFNFELFCIDSKSLHKCHTFKHSEIKPSVNWRL